MLIVGRGESLAESPILVQATEAVLQGSSPKPDPHQVVQALLAAEKTFRQEKPSHPFDLFIGTWRLCFITGTRKTRQKAGIVLGAGRYLPSLIRITLTYDRAQAQDLHSGTFAAGQVINQVDLGILKFKLNGPTKLLPHKPIMAFDFNHLILDLLGIKLIERDIRGGIQATQRFYEERINQQAFFVYFLVQEQLIAARGRGGGLALWGRIPMNEEG